MSKRVLVVEDSPDQASLITFILKKEGYEVRTAKDGIEALTMIREGLDVELLVTDLVMPRMDGFSLIRELKDEGRTLPTIVITAKRGEQEALENLHLDTLGVILKPFQADDVRKEVKNALSRASQA